MQKRAAKIVKQYWDATLHAFVTVYAAKRVRKQVTAKTSKSIKHCGRTNAYGICV